MVLTAFALAALVAALPKIAYADDLGAGQAPIGQGDVAAESEPDYEDNSWRYDESLSVEKLCELEGVEMPVEAEEAVSPLPIPGGWYISVHSKRYINNFINATELAQGTFASYGNSAAVPWNMFVYKPVMTPTAPWSAS